jgi:hypothetical protein
MSLVKKQVSSNSIPKKGTIHGVMMIPISTARLTKLISTVKTLERNSLVVARSFSRRYALKVGMKATDMDPSAKSRRNRFGIKNATEKASERALVPKRLALTISLRRPRIREIKVSNDRIEP